jgi:hypothetical protein
MQKKEDEKHKQKSARSLKLCAGKKILSRLTSSGCSKSVKRERERERERKRGRRGKLVAIA